MGPFRTAPLFNPNRYRVVYSPLFFGAGTNSARAAAKEKRQYAGDDHDDEADPQGHIVTAEMDGDSQQ